VSILIGILFEVGTVIMAGRITNMYDDEDEESAENNEMKHIKEIGEKNDGNGQHSQAIANAT